MTREERKEIENVLNELGVQYKIEDTEALIEFWTDTAGQNIPVEFNYDGSGKNFIEEFTSFAENYDVDEEVEIFIEMRGKRGVPDTVRELLDDCQEAKDTLMQIATRLKEAENVVLKQAWLNAESHEQLTEEEADELLVNTNIESISCVFDDFDDLALNELDSIGVEEWLYEYIDIQRFGEDRYNADKDRLYRLKCSGRIVAATYEVCSKKNK